MADEASEQDKSETATPFKLDRARKRGSLARGHDLGFVSSLVAVAIIAQAAGPGIYLSISQTMKRAIVDGMAAFDEPAQASMVAGTALRQLFVVLALPAFILLAIGIAVEVVQNRGLIFSAQPLKPDFSRLNPAKGFKRFFSLRLLKERPRTSSKWLYTALQPIFL